eukprot:334511-Pleurochrysis_carterae.AAC.1
MTEAAHAETADVNMQHDDHAVVIINGANGISGVNGAAHANDHAHAEVDTAAEIEARIHEALATGAAKTTNA